MEDRTETMEDRKDSVEAEIDQAAEILGSRLMDSLQEYKHTLRLNNVIQQYTYSLLYETFWFSLDCSFCVLFQSGQKS
jgi:hypothetical protein